MEGRIEMTRLGLVINLDTCLDHRGCMTACKRYRSTPMGVYNTETLTSTGGKYPDAAHYFIPVMCQQCGVATCVEACRPGALRQREDGVVVLSAAEKCAGCEDKGCQKACPYDAIHYDASTERAYKCDMCVDRLDEGRQPRCIEGCLTMSWFAGDFDDESSVVSQIVDAWGANAHQLRPESGNKPNSWYLLSQKPWNDMNSLYSPNWHEDKE
jgi:Fe-S-cluster-containing dehydrogenase component